ncbi:ABC transporter permease [Paenibacillus sp. MSJ-34]|uniref:ABC transporter permease n=1 Tax=Paenibacillus sp. MSJ-34 TaxID=2841529 RepID=UPI001C103D13|nr:ABC transporter permease [Paenibacillus sp. MSJ-34]MBU5440553.1 ABC transporter permease [Paenibacillus sp. MSJ-34]
MSGWNQFKKLFGMHFKSTFREKQVWFWSIFYPVLLMIIFIMIFGGNGSDSFSAKIAVVETNANAVSGQWKETIRHIPVLEWENESQTDRDRAEQMLKDKDVDAVLILPESDQERNITLLFNREKQNSATAQALGSIFKDIVNQVNFDVSGVTPQFRLQTDYVSAGSQNLKYSDFLLTGLIALSISQSGLFGMVGLVEMRRNGLMKRLKMTPMNMKLFGIGDISVRFILSVVQIILLSALGLIFFQAHFNINILSFLLIFVIGTLSFAGIGFLIASVSKSIESYMGIANLLSFLMMFLSGIFFDINALPAFIKPISTVLPLTYFANGVRDGMVFGAGIEEPSLWINCGVMAAWGLAAMLLASRLFRRKGETK